MSCGSPSRSYTPEEQETIIRWDQASDTAEIGTMSPQLIRQLQRRGVAPETSELDGKGRVVAATYAVPRTWIKVSPPRRVSETQREAARRGMQVRHQDRF